MKTKINYKGQYLIVTHSDGALRWVTDSKGNFKSIDTNEWQSVMKKVNNEITSN